MASYSHAKSVHKTLVAATVDDVTLTGRGGRVEIMNRTGTAEIYFTLDGTAPTVKGDGTDVIPASVGASVILDASLAADSGSEVIKLISSGTPEYSVIARPSLSRKK